MPVIRCKSHGLIVPASLLAATLAFVLTARLPSGTAGQAAEEGGRQQSSVAAAVGAGHDQWIAGQIEGAYRVDEDIDIFDLTVQVEDGVVTVSGALDSEIDRRRAIEIAEETWGVEAVIDELTVTGPAAPRTRQSP